MKMKNEREKDKIIHQILPKSSSDDGSEEEENSE